MASNKNVKRIRKKAKPTPVTVVEKPKSKWKWIVASITLISTVIGIIVAVQPLKEQIASAHENWINKHYVKGVHIPLAVTQNSPNITFQLGHLDFLVPQIDYLNGHEVDLAETHIEGFHLKSKIINNRLYVSVILKDIMTKDVIGDMTFNEWKFKNESIFDFYDEDDGIEIIDKNGYVVFGMRYDNNKNKVIIRGYFLDEDNYCYVVTDEIINSSTATASPELVLSSIRQIKPLKNFKSGKTMQ